MNTETPAKTGSPWRNVALLSIGQAVSGSNQVIIAAIGGLTAASITPNKALVTLPITAMILGLALATGPAAYLIHRLGRRDGFALGAALTIPAALLAAGALVWQNFVLFCIALALMGASNAFGQQYRFAAADSVDGPFKARAISFVLVGGVVAAFLGPALSTLSYDWIAGRPFVATYLVIGGLALISVFILWQTRFARAATPQEARTSGRSFRQLLATPDVVVPIIGATASYSLMTLVMVAAPLAMVYVSGQTTVDATGAIQWHVLAMFAPSFVTGWIVSRLGAHLTAALGLVLIVGSALVSLSGITLTHFSIGLVLLGVGWNFGFIGSTALLTGSYLPEDAAKVQGLNEQLVFGSMAVASISSGLLLELLGWQAINILALPIAAIGIAALAWGEWQQRKRKREAAEVSG